MITKGREHIHFLSSRLQQIGSAIRREEKQWTPPKNAADQRHLDEFVENGKPLMVGDGIVSCIAFMETFVPKKGKSWIFPRGWYGTNEFNNFRAIRHCFGHMKPGAILPNRKQEISDFLGFGA